MAALDAAGDMLSVWHTILSHADYNKITKLTKSGSVYGLGIAEFRSTNSYSPSVESTMTTTTMRFQTAPEKRPSTVMHINAAKKNFS